MISHEAAVVGSLDPLLKDEDKERVRSGSENSVTNRQCLRLGLVGQARAIGSSVLLGDTRDGGNTGVELTQLGVGIQQIVGDACGTVAVQWQYRWHSLVLR